MAKLGFADSGCDGPGLDARQRASAVASRFDGAAAAIPSCIDDLLRALLDGRPWEPLGTDQAADPAGPFCAVVSTIPVPAPPGWSARLTDDGRCWLLAQLADAGTLLSGVRGRAGIGSVRTGWAGARESLVDAELAWQLSRDGAVCFDQDWLLASVLRDRQRLAELTAPGRAVAARATYLSDAVEAFAEHRLSVVAAARALHVHPNTVIYRLHRWRTLTGWDPRTLHGLALSVASLRLDP